MSQLKDYNVRFQEDEKYFYVDFAKKVNPADGIGLTYAIKKTRHEDNTGAWKIG